MNISITNSSRKLAALVSACLLAACGGGGGGGGSTVAPVAPPAASNYPVGGSIGGLRGVVTLTSNGQTLELAGDGSFNFATAIPSGTAYSVSVGIPPLGQACSVTQGAGTVGSGAITSVNVSCMDTPGQVLLRVFVGPGQAVAGAKVKATVGGSATVYTGTVDASGAATLLLPAASNGPFLLEAVSDRDEYYDFALGFNRKFITNSDPFRTSETHYLWRAMAASLPIDKNLAVTPLTEIATGRALYLAGKAALSAADISTANGEVAAAFGLSDLLKPPSLLKAGSKLAGSVNADDRYALITAGLMKFALLSDDSVSYALREDFVDGMLDGRLHFIRNTAIDGNVLTMDPKTGATPAQFAATLNSQIAAATAVYAAPGVNAPTIAPIVLEGRRFYVNGQALVTDRLLTTPSATPTLHNAVTAEGKNYIADNRSGPFASGYFGKNCTTVVVTGLPLTISSCDVTGQTYRYHIIENIGSRAADVCWQRAGASVNVCELQVLQSGSGTSARVQILGTLSQDLQIIGFDDRTNAD